MYEQASIQKLSQPQIKKLLKGQPVRVKHGNGMSVVMTKAQHKKLMSAHKKGAGTILQLDPYLQQRGQGVITDVIKEIAVELAPHAIDALANVAKRRVGKGVVSEVVKEIGQELLPVAIDAVAKQAKKKVGKGKNIFGTEAHTNASDVPFFGIHNLPNLHGKGVVSDVVKEIGKELAPIAIDAVAKQAKKKVGKGVKATLPSVKEEVVKVVKEIGKELAPHAIDAVAKSAKNRVGKGKSGASEFFGKIGDAFKSRFNDQGTPIERKATSVILNQVEPALIKPLQVLAPPVGQIAEAQRDILKTHYGLGQMKRPKLVKGSPEAKAYMASIRAKKNGGALMVAGEGYGGALAPAGSYYYQ